MYFGVKIYFNNSIWTNCRTNALLCNEIPLISRQNKFEYAFSWPFKSNAVCQFEVMCKIIGMNRSSYHMNCILRRKEENSAIMWDGVKMRTFFLRFFIFGCFCAINIYARSGMLNVAYVPKLLTDSNMCICALVHICECEFNAEYL